jgi:uncharacterized protein (UPF0332 family)
MNDVTAALLARARREVAAARTLVGKGFTERASSCAYFAAFYAAEAALSELGESRSKNSGVISAFGRRVVKDGGFDPATGKLLKDLFEARNEADYMMVDIDVSEAEASIHDAERFVDAVERRLGAQ